MATNFSEDAVDHLPSGMGQNSRTIQSRRDSRSRPQTKEHYKLPLDTTLRYNLDNLSDRSAQNDLLVTGPILGNKQNSEYYIGTTYGRKPIIPPSEIESANINLPTFRGVQQSNRMKLLFNNVKGNDRSGDTKDITTEPRDIRNEAVLTLTDWPQSLFGVPTGARKSSFAMHDFENKSRIENKHVYNHKKPLNRELSSHEPHIFLGRQVPTSQLKKTFSGRESYISSPYPIKKGPIASKTDKEELYFSNPFDFSNHPAKSPLIRKQQHQYVPSSSNRGINWKYFNSNTQ